MKFEWEKIGGGEEFSSSTYRIKVFGGWLVNNLTTIETHYKDGRQLTVTESMVFVPDPEHKWEIDKT